VVFDVVLLAFWWPVEYNTSRDWIVANMSLSRDVQVQLFEITIRALGGLLSIYHLTQEQGFLDAAVSKFSFFLACRLSVCLSVHLFVFFSETLISCP